jgi:beta-glucosidase
LGHQQGIHAPGDKLGVREWLRAGHHLLLSHGRAVQALRARAKVRPKVGYAPVGCLRLPASNSPRDVKAARRATFAVTAKDAWNSSWWMDPVFFGRYPEDGLKLFGADAPEVRPGDLKLISQPLDFFGVNLYSASRVRAGKDGRPEAAPARIGPPLTAFHWEVTPEILYYGPKFYHERYGLPIYVTENGMAGCDWVSLDGKVRDPQRIDYLHRYFREFARAAADGVDARGCFVWSLMDNFEWAEGYKQRFGLIHVNYETQARTPKDSFYWYKEVIAANGENLLPP